MIIQENITHSFQSPIVRIFLVVIGTGLLYVLWREVRKIPPKLLVLMARIDSPSVFKLIRERGSQ